jgi:hypothetical protein
MGSLYEALPLLEGHGEIRALPMASPGLTKVTFQITIAMAGLSSCGGACQSRSRCHFCVTDNIGPTGVVSTMVFAVHLDDDANPLG